MDFLDPRKKRTRTIRLMLGYSLMAIAIGLATVVLVYGASGYGIDTKTGQITENGLLFVDSKPGGADIFLNGVNQKKTTSARMILGAGQYDLSLKKAGYREWKRSFTLDEHSIKRYVYPLLIPTELAPGVVKNYNVAPPLISQTPDRRWLLVQSQSAAASITFDMFDTQDFKEPSRPITLPASLFSGYNPASSRLLEVEWSSNNDYLLLQHISAQKSEFIVVDRTSPADSFNLNRLFKTDPSKVVLRDKKINQFYFYDEPSRSLRVADFGSRTLEPVLIQDVIAFKTYGRNLVSYITATNAAPGTVLARIWDDGRSYGLNKLAPGSRYLLDIAQFQGDWYYIATSDAEPRVNIYKNPLSYTKDKNLKAAPPMLALNVTGTTAAAFSANTRFLNVQAGAKFATYDFEVEEAYIYDMPLPLAAPMTWMDGHRLMGNSGNNLFIMDYDATNQQMLVPTALSEGGYFSRDYNQLYALTPATGTSPAVLTRTDLRAGDDLPEEFR